jgi:hypothetical protein
MVSRSAENVPTNRCAKSSGLASGSVRQQRPDPVGERHPVAPDHATGVEVVLDEATGEGVGRDDHEAVGELRLGAVGALQQEPATERPLEHRPAGGDVGEHHLLDPLPDEDVERGELGGSSVRCGHGPSRCAELSARP